MSSSPRWVPLLLAALPQPFGCSDHHPPVQSQSMRQSLKNSNETGVDKPGPHDKAASGPPSCASGAMVCGVQNRFGSML